MFAEEMLIQQEKNSEIILQTKFGLEKMVFEYNLLTFHIWSTKNRKQLETELYFANKTRTVQFLLLSNYTIIVH